MLLESILFCFCLTLSSSFSLSAKLLSQFSLHKVLHISQKHCITVPVEAEYFYILLFAASLISFISHHFCFLLVFKVVMSTMFIMKLGFVS